MHRHYMINIFEFQNYRLYLKAYYEFNKSAKKYFSYRYFSKKAGINASAFLYYVIEGKRNLTKSSIDKISAAIGHSEKEISYFENLVFFNQAKTIAEKAIYYSRLLNGRKPLDLKIVNRDQYEFYGTWYHSIIREVACLVDFRNDFAALGSYVIPPISAAQVKESVDLLIRLGLIEHDDDGIYHQTDAVLSTKPQGPDAFVLEKFQSEMLDMAQKSFDRIPRGSRMSASTTFSISEATFELFKIRTREFRKELLEIAKLDTQPERVFQFTFNLFPVSRPTHE